MKINWKVRIQSYKFWVALFALAGLVVSDLGVMAIGKFDTYVEAILVILVAGGIITDPVVSGLSDSEQAMNYKKPKKDKKNLK